MERARPLCFPTTTTTTSSSSSSSSSNYYNPDYLLLLPNRISTKWSTQHVPHNDDDATFALVCGAAVS